MGRHQGPVPTEEIVSQIIAYIRSGGFPHVAAEASGISRETFTLWLANGSPDNKNFRMAHRKLFQRLYHGVIQARAQARLTAEIGVFKDDPAMWLRNGPGKETANDPGWSATPKADRSTNVNIVLPGQEGLPSLLLQVLAPYPEARLAVSQALIQRTLELEDKRPRRDS